jgi:hypothetical protein
MRVIPPPSAIVLCPPKMVCDKPISKHIPEPLPNTAHYMVSCGPPRSGKTSTLLAMLTQTTPPIYKKAFHNLMVIMPKSSRASLKLDPFASLDERKVFTELTVEGLDKVHKICEGYMKEGKQSLLYVDDMASSLKNTECLQAWNKLINNRRHLRLSVWCIVQTYKSIPISNRKTITHLLVFKPNNRSEGESITEELVMMPVSQWDSYVTYAFGEGKPHSFLFLDVEKQAVYDSDFARLEADSVPLEEPSKKKQKSVSPI